MEFEVFPHRFISDFRVHLIEDAFLQDPKFGCRLGSYSSLDRKCKRIINYIFNLTRQNSKEFESVDRTVSEWAVYPRPTSKRSNVQGSLIFTSFHGQDRYYSYKNVRSTSLQRARETSRIHWVVCSVFTELWGELDIHTNDVGLQNVSQWQLLQLCRDLWWFRRRHWTCSSTPYQWH
jgi:hypothetical protein